MLPIFRFRLLKPKASMILSKATKSNPAYAEPEILRRQAAADNDPQLSFYIGRF
jgi:hypothetical protein